MILVVVRSDDVRLRRLVTFAMTNGMEQNRVRAGGIKIFVHRIFSLILPVLMKHLSV